MVYMEGLYQRVATISETKSMEEIMRKDEIRSGVQS
jgi:hypothetical protein